MWPKIGPCETYTILYIGGIIVHLVICLLLAWRMGLRYRVAIVVSVCFQLGMTVGAKVLYDVQYIGLNLRDLLSWEHYKQGGLWGGPLAFLVLAVLFVLLLAKQKRTALDLVAWSLPIPMILAKVACLCNGCCYGTVCSLPWAIRFPEGGPAPANTPLHPTQIYEMLVLICILAVFCVLDRKRWRGMLLFWFLFLYGLGRPITEFFRGDKHESFTLGYLSVSQIVCLATAFMSVVLLRIYYVYTPTPQQQCES